MKSYQIGLYEKAIPKTMTWAEKLLCAKDAGFDYVEISIDETDDRLERLHWSAEERREVCYMMEKIGTPIRSMCLSAHRKYPMGSHDPELRRRSMEIMTGAIQLSEDLGIRTIQLAGYDVYYEQGDGETRRWFSENLQRAADQAASAGILLGFETMETPFMNTVEKAMNYVRLLDSPYLGVYPDLGNITNAAKSCGTDVQDDLEIGRGHLIAMHLKETLPGVFREVPFGTGHVDFEAGIRKAWSLGVRRYVTEMWDVGRDSWKADIQAANQMMTAILDRQENKNL